MGKWDFLWYGTADIRADRQSDDPLRRFRGTWVKLVFETCVALLITAVFAGIAVLVHPDLELSYRIHPGSIFLYWIASAGWVTNRIWCWSAD